MIPSVLPVYKRLDVQFVRGEGSYLFTADGTRYLDYAAGIAVCAFGHANPRLIKALTAQAEKVWIVSNMFRVPGQELVAEKIRKLTFADTVFFTNSGVEAWECGVKIIRKHFAAKGQPERNRIIVCEGAFHGRTLGAISAAKTPKMVDGFAPLLDGFDQIPFNDLEALEAAITPQTAAIHFEPVQGEGGIRPATMAFMKKARELCDKHGLLLFFDEIQCGMGRTGKLWAYEFADIKPDVMCIAKGFGGGFPVGACIATENAASGMSVGSHGSTYGGNPLAMAVASEVLDMIQEPHILPHVNEMAARLEQGLQKLADDFPHIIGEVRGKGLMQGISMKSGTYADMHAALMAKQLITVGAGKDVIRFVPPLTISATEVDEALDILRQTCQEMGHD